MTNLEVKMKVNSIAMLTRGMEMRDRALDLARDGMPDVQIAAVLTGEGIAPLTAREMSSQSPSTGSGAQPASR